MLNLWGRPNSSNVKKVLWTLEELNIPYQNTAIGGTYGGTDTPQYRAMNPNGLVPTLQDGDFFLWESNTIVRYLAATYGKDKLWIEDPKNRAQAEKWMDWALSALFIPFGTILQQKVRLPKEQRDPALAQSAIAKFEQGLALIEQELAKTGWLSGENFGIGDIVPGVAVYYYYELKLYGDLKFPNVESWYKRLSERPAYRKTVMTPIT